MPERAEVSQEGSGYVRVDRRDGVAIVSLNHPEDRNALSFGMTRALAEAVHRVEVDDDHRGSRARCDRHSVLGGGIGRRSPRAKGAAQRDVRRVRRSPRDRAADRGRSQWPALGAGMNLALACDLIVCSPSARFETRFLDVGLHPGGGHLWQLRQRIGRQGAAALSLFGETLDGEEAVRRQLAWRCVPEAELLETAWQLASRAAGHDRALIERTRRTLAESSSVVHAADAVSLELEPQQWSMGRPEFLDALGRLRTRLGRGENTSPTWSSALPDDR